VDTTTKKVASCTIRPLYAYACVTSPQRFSSVNCMKWR
jgi:hypothetical protein